MTEITYRGYTITRDGDTWVATRGEGVQGPARFAYFSSLDGLKDSINGVLDRPRLERRPYIQPAPPPPPSVTIGHKSRVYPWAGVLLGLAAWIVLLATVMALKHWVLR